MAKPWHLLSCVVITVMLASCAPPPVPKTAVSVPVAVPTPEPKPEEDIALNAESEAAIAKAAEQQARIDEDETILITPASKADPAKIDLLEKLMVPDPRPEDAPKPDTPLADILKPKADQEDGKTDQDDAKKTVEQTGFSPKTIDNHRMG